MIMGVTGGKALPTEIANQIIDRTDGVPLFIEELTKSVVESGLVTEAVDLYTMSGPVMPLAIPTTLQASLLARLDRLAPTREVAQIGAALGRSFSHELISAVAGMPEQQLDDALQQLEQFPPDVNLFVDGGFPSCSKSDSVLVTIRGEDDHGKGLFDRLESSCGGFGRGRRELPGSRAPA
jgi:hypothetical protein